MKSYQITVTSLFYKYLLLVLSIALLSSCTEEKKSYLGKVKIKIMTHAGKVLSGYNVYRDQNKIGKINSFGEWEDSFQLDNLQPFFLTLKSEQKHQLFAKKVLIDFNNQANDNGELYISRKIIIPFEEKHNSLVISKKSAEIIEEAYSKIHFHLSNCSHLTEEAQIDFTKQMTKALRKKVKDLDLKYSTKALWQIYLEPFSRINKDKKSSHAQWVKVVTKLPYKENKIKFILKYRHNNPDNSVNELFTLLRKKISYPYPIIKKGKHWFIVSSKEQQKSLWQMNKKLILENPAGMKFHAQDKKLNYKSQILTAIAPSRHNPCLSSGSKPCYLYSKVNL